MSVGDAVPCFPGTVCAVAVDTANDASYSWKREFESLDDRTDFVQRIWLDNTSRSACYLAGAPTLTLMTTTGRQIPVAPNPTWESMPALAGPGGQVVVTYGYPGDCTNISNSMNLSEVIMSFPGGNITVPAAPGLAFSCGTPHIEDYGAVHQSQNTTPPGGSIIGPAG